MYRFLIHLCPKTDFCSESTGGLRRIRWRASPILEFQDDGSLRLGLCRFKFPLLHRVHCAFLKDRIPSYRDGGLPRSSRCDKDLHLDLAVTCIRLAGSLGAVWAITFRETSCASEARRKPKPNSERDRPATVSDAAGKSTSAYWGQASASSLSFLKMRNAERTAPASASQRCS